MKLTTRRKNSLLLARKIFLEYEKLYKAGFRVELIFEKIGAAFNLAPFTARNKYYDYLKQSDEIKKLLA